MVRSVHASHGGPASTPRGPENSPNRPVVDSHLVLPALPRDPNLLSTSAQPLDPLDFYARPRSSTMASLCAGCGLVTAIAVVQLCAPILVPLYNAAPMAGTILEVGIFVLVGLPIAKYFDMLPLKRALGRYAKRQAYGLPHEDAATGLQMIAGFNRRLKESSEPNRAAS